LELDERGSSEGPNVPKKERGRDTVGTAGAQGLKNFPVAVFKDKFEEQRGEKQSRLRSGSAAASGASPAPTSNSRPEAAATKARIVELDGGYEVAIEGDVTVGHARSVEGKGGITLRVEED